jgi:hypothetical protein
MDKCVYQEASGIRFLNCIAILSIRAILFMDIAGLIWAKNAFGDTG